MPRCRASVAGWRGVDYERMRMQCVGCDVAVAYDADTDFCRAIPQAAYAELPQCLPLRLWRRLLFSTSAPWPSERREVMSATLSLKPSTPVLYPLERVRLVGGADYFTVFTAPHVRPLDRCGRDTALCLTLYGAVTLNPLA